MTEAFSERVLRWYDAHGRKHLPWQQNPTPYRVWVSEIMLQQTQVATVISYFERFMLRFPDVVQLANADEDAVLHHWSGLGYYARARNLHHAARIIRDTFNGEFPREFDSVAALPGIGRSTAGAVLSLGCEQRHPILDGNVKRVFARHAAIEGWPGRTPVANALWDVAEKRLPTLRVNHYNQALMDIGATVCVRSRPRCDACPVAIDCRARLESRQHEFPGKKVRAALPEKHVDVILLEHKGRIFLEKRPPSGIWGGLWSLPESDNGERWLAEQFGRPVPARELALVTHVFSHFRLHLRPLHATVSAPPQRVSDSKSDWFDFRRPMSIGLAAPVQRILADFTAQFYDGERNGTDG